VTRVAADQTRAVRKKFPKLKHHVVARCLTLEDKPLPKRKGKIAVVTAGTSDLPVAEEAAVTASIMGNRIDRITDVGIAGIPAGTLIINAMTLVTHVYDGLPEERIEEIEQISLDRRTISAEGVSIGNIVCQ